MHVVYRWGYMDKLVLGCVIFSCIAIIMVRLFYSKSQKRKEPIKKENNDHDKHGKINNNDGKQVTKKKKMMQHMQCGIKYRDMKIGTGDLITPGDKLRLFYVAQTVPGKTVIDKSISGKGFHFIYGKGHISGLKSWDIGLTGMRVSGKRQFIIPRKFPILGEKYVEQYGSVTFTIEIKSKEGNQYDKKYKDKEKESAEKIKKLAEENKKLQAENNKLKREIRRQKRETEKAREKASAMNSVIFAM